jgi:N-acetylneuraminate synthase
MHNAPHPCAYNSFGTTYLEHRKALEFDIEQHAELKYYAESLGIQYSCSIWDMDSAKEIIDLNPYYIKVPSACNTNFVLLDYLYKNYQNDIHISLGMSTKREINKILSYCKKYKDRTVIYWTTSDYPVKFNELYLLELNNIPKCFEKGFSGHHNGIAIDIATIPLGVTWIERHFTLDRTSKGTDHAAALEPPGLTKLVRDVNATAESLEYKEDLTEGEKTNRNKLRNANR